MPVERKVRDRIPYTLVLARAIDRVAEARAQIQGGLTRGEYNYKLSAFRAAAMSLYIILPGSVRKTVGPPPSSLGKLEEWVSKVIQALDNEGLLINVKTEEVGGELLNIKPDL